MEYLSDTYRRKIILVGGSIDGSIKRPQKNIFYDFKK
jgi:hypothetical protein